METPRALRIWHVGNWCIHLRQTYVESPFKSEKKDVEMLNETRLREGCEAVVEIHDKGAWYPLLASRTYSGGRVTSWTMGASPHWAINFMKWKQYPQLWKQVFVP
jgi:uncharacterized membrane protein